jgi:Lipase maturation factor
MLQSGPVKLFSGDASWRNLTALNFHFETQPLPTALAWYAEKLPEAMLQAAARDGGLVDPGVCRELLACRGLAVAGRAAELTGLTWFFF